MLEINNTEIAFRLLQLMERLQGTQALLNTFIKASVNETGEEIPDNKDEYIELLRMPYKVIQGEINHSIEELDKITSMY